MEYRTASARADLEVSLRQRGDQETPGEGFLPRRAFRGALEASGVATDD